ncbi:TIGR04013 family B12-binding domain/radical SAM domain-containing protein [Pyrobaculum sp.]|uniref:TIGR04013 family B12-binding domain/radical SAM domain-containing protein n=1 Tax=Pyrobaculum sp. TaxID=2004705 RepID=UPI003180FC34
MILLARLFEGPNNGMAYAVAPVEDKYRIVPTRDPLRDAAELASKGEKVLVLYSLSTPLFIEYWKEVVSVASRYPTVVGGPHAVGDPVTLLKLGVKYVVVGDGEVALPAIIQREEEGGGTPPNTMVVENGKIRAGRRVYVELMYKTYSESLGIYPPIEITRSCAYRCAFCQTWGHGPVRHRPLHNIAEIVKVYVKRGISEIRFVAPVGFLYGSTDGKTPNIDALTSLLRTVRELGGAPYLGSFPSETRPETVTPDVLKAVRPYVANRRISIGLQTASEKLLKAVKRGHDVAVVEEAVKNARVFGFKPVVDVIAGLPGEDGDDVEATVREMEKLVKMGAYIRMHYYIPLPGTPLWGRRPQPPHRLYFDFVKKYKRRVEGYFEEQIRLSQKIYQTYEEIASYLSLTTPSSTAS